MRRDAGLTLRELGARAGTSHSTLSAYESGRVDPSTATFDRIVRAAGFSSRCPRHAASAREGGLARGDELGRGARARRAVSRPPRRSLRSPRCSPARVTLVDKIVAIHHALDDAGLPHAFGGALALGVVHATGAGHHRHRRQRVRRRRRAAERARRAARRRRVDRRRPAPLERDGQVRLWWDAHAGRRLPEHHRVPRAGRAPGAARAVRRRRRAVPGVHATSRCSRRSSTAPRTGPTSRRWSAAGTLDVDRVVGVLVRYLGADDERIERLRRLVPPPT